MIVGLTATFGYESGGNLGNGGSVSSTMRLFGICTSALSGSREDKVADLGWDTDPSPRDFDIGVDDAISRASILSRGNGTRDVKFFQYEFI